MQTGVQKWACASKARANKQREIQYVLQTRCLELVQAQAYH